MQRCDRSLSIEKSPTDRNVVALIKQRINSDGHGDNERFIFIFDAAGRSETLRTLGRFASDPDLNFSWFDAATLSQAVRDA